jgi:hypothetical protein
MYFAHNCATNVEHTSDTSEQHSGYFSISEIWKPLQHGSPYNTAHFPRTGSHRWNGVRQLTFVASLSLHGSFNHAVAASLQQSALHCSSVPEPSRDDDSLSVSNVAQLPNTISATAAQHHLSHSSLFWAELPRQ